MNHHITPLPLSSVGLCEEDAKQQGLKFKLKHEDTSGWYSSKRVDIKYSAYKTLVEEETGRILGAHLLVPHAEEVIRYLRPGDLLGAEDGRFENDDLRSPDQRI